MNVIFLTLSRVVDINTGGIYTDLIRKFRQYGHNLYIVCPFERKYTSSTQLIEQDGVKILGVKTLNIQKTSFLEKGIGMMLLEHQYKIAIEKYLKDIRFDLILYSTPPINITRVLKYLQTNNPSAISYLMLKDMSPQDLIDLEVFSKANPLCRYLRSVERRLYQMSDYIGCMSPANIDYVLTHNPEIDPKRVELAVNSIDPTIIPEKKQGSSCLRSKYDIPESALVLMYGGNFGVAQGIDFILSCLDYYKGDNTVYFILIGAGTHFNKLKRWCKENASCKNVIVQSMMPRNEYETLLHVADVGLIFLDHRFTFPNYPSRLLSYLSHKMPILAATDIITDIGRIAEANKYGVWCESDNLEGFVHCVDRLKQMDSNQFQEMGENGYSYLMKNYLTENTYQSIIAHFNSTDNKKELNYELRNTQD